MIIAFQPTLTIMSYSDLCFYVVSFSTLVRGWNIPCFWTSLLHGFFLKASTVCIHRLQWNTRYTCCLISLQSGSTYNVTCCELATGLLNLSIFSWPSGQSASPSVSHFIAVGHFCLSADSCKTSMICQSALSGPKCSFLQFSCLEIVSCKDFIEGRQQEKRSLLVLAHLWNLVLLGIFSSCSGQCLLF